MLHLNHRRAEALFVKYSGLHKWNIDYDKYDNFIVWNDKNAINVSQSLGDIVKIKVCHTDDYEKRKNQNIIVDITKIREFELSQFIDIKEERKLLAAFLGRLMDWIESQKLS